MIQASEQIARQYANAADVKRTWGDIIFNVKVFGAKGDGLADDAPFIQAAVKFVKNVGGGVVYFPVGTYLISTPIVVSTDPLNPVELISFVGVDCQPSYNQSPMLSLIKAAPNFPAGSPMLDLRYTKRTVVSNLGINGISGVNGTRGIEYGERVSTGRVYSNHRIEHCSIHEHYYGITSSNSGLFAIMKNNISSCYRAGIALLQFSGDSEIEGNYINTCNVDYVGDDLLTGCGIVLTDGSGNTNIRGGKIEWNAKGIVVFGSVGINITGINFDINKWAHIVISGNGNGYNAAMGWTISGCRFLGGGTYKSADSIGKAHIELKCGAGTTVSGAITGNTFKKAGTDAYDNNTTGDVGPQLYGIHAQGDGKMRVSISGNEMHDCAAVNTLGAYGADIKLYAAGNSWNLSSLPNYIDGGATLTTG